MEKLVDSVKEMSTNAKDAITSPQTLNKGDKKVKKQAEGSSANAPLELSPAPEYLAHRLALFEKLKQKQDQFYADQERKQITITLPDGATKIGTSYETSPMSVAAEISKGLADKTVIAKVNGALWDLTRPLEESCSLQLIDFSDPEGKQVFWHSSAHILGEACERHYGCHLANGPPTEDGFFYQMALPEGGTIQSGDYAPLEQLVSGIVKEKQPFERLEMSKDDLLEMFKHNRFKQHLIKDKIPDGTRTTVYRCGPLIDLCRGPHLPHTGKVKSFSVMKNSSAYFLNDANNESLQRVYGASFPDKKAMTEYKTFLAEAAKRDHRKLGREQDLFFFNELSPGSCLLLPHGTIIYNTLVNLMKAEYRKRGYQEVMTPNIYKKDLWETSGHWQNYSENMFSFEVEKETFALKPMNCPGHCLVFNYKDRSYRELPLRLADFGVLHRNEFSGALTGLTRVRRFQQDDAHIFCTPDQVKTEIAGVFDFLKHVYGIFGFTFKLELSTRPEKYLGDLETWNMAEKQLEEALIDFKGKEWELNPADGAFYGPKIDITISDALKRQYQCATIQLDFQLPQKFELEYAAGASAVGQGKAAINRPVMIHRAILGSVERMIAILTEHYAGKWPFWLSPRQVMVIPVIGTYNGYAQRVCDQLYSAGFNVETDLTANTMKKKVLNAQTDQFNFVFIVGETEEKENSVNVRNCRDESKQARTETIALTEVFKRLERMKESKTLSNEL